MTISHWYAPENIGHDAWNSRYHLGSFLVLAVHDFVVFGAIFPFLIWKYVAILHSMRSVCRDLTRRGALIVRPLSPDKAGGLGFFGKYSLTMVTLLVPPIITIMVYIYSGNLTVVLMMGISTYVLVLAFAFFYPLSGAHSAMNSIKSREARVLSLEFNQAYDSFIQKVNEKRHEELPREIELVDSLDRLYSRSEKMPVWPFDTGTLAKFLGILGGLAGSIWVNWIASRL
jgi:hypothetical protein